VDRESEKDMKMEIDFDILFNCILLNKDYNRTWFNSNTQFNKHKVIVDISCDYTKINNPIKLYNKATSWKEPIFKYNKFLDIIAIENLPSLLPYESSIDFSKKCTELLLQYDSNVWNNNLLEFYNATYFI
jgi:saccharopine dehydrogenase (NAD+, L-lysine-forming)